MQYNIYQNTMQVLKAVRSDNIKRIQHELSSQGAILSAAFKHALPRLTSTWSSVQSNLPKNIFNFNVRYMNNTLTTRTKPSLVEAFANIRLLSLLAPRIMSLLDARYILRRVGILGATTLL